MILPSSDLTPLIRTDFSDDERWTHVVAAAMQTSAEGFSAKLQIVDDKMFDGVDPDRLIQLAAESSHVLLILADYRTMTDPEMSLLCIDPIPPGGRFRAVPDHLWGIENSVSLANMDFIEFAEAVSPDGVFRGFHD